MGGGGEGEEWMGWPVMEMMSPREREPVSRERETKRERP